MAEIQAIDIMNYPHYCMPELWEKALECEEVKTVFKTTFKVMGRPEDFIAKMSLPSVEAMLAEMDEAGYEYVFMSAFKMWSFRRHFRFIMDGSTSISVKL